MIFLRVLFFAAVGVVLINDAHGDESRGFDDPDTIQYQDDGNAYVVNAGVKSVKSVKGKTRYRFVGGCKHEPDAPIHGNIQCSRDSGCIATCSADYQFPNGVSQLAVICHEKEWHIQGTEWSTVPQCEPICLPACQNKGICVAPYQCNCPEQFTGPQCQFENRPCLNLPPPVHNSLRQCSSTLCTVSCHENFVFPDGTSVTNLICKDGNWQPSRSDWVTVPDCTPVCTPPCQNGGICLPLNVCQCPQDFRGPQCQYSANNCSPEKMEFNGGFYCTSVNDIYSCTLNCPVGIQFEFPPATAYTCTFDKGIFEPQPIPHCMYGDGVEAISIGTSYTSHQIMRNHTMSFNTLSTSNENHMHEASTRYNRTSFFNSFHSDFNNKLYDQEQSFNSYGGVKGNIMVIEVKQPKPSLCFAWGKGHYKTFDDQVFSFESGCAYILLQDEESGSLTITAQDSPGCKHNAECYKTIKIFIAKKEYTLTRDELGIPIFRGVKKTFPLPVQLPSLRAEMVAHFVLITIDAFGISLKWDGASFVQIEAAESMWNRTLGLCGRMNGEISDDLMSKSGTYPKNLATFVTSWQVDNVGEACFEYPSTEHPCARFGSFESATDFCTGLLSNPKFHICSDSIDLSYLQSTCQWDYCSCSDANKGKCACDTMNVHVRQCTHKGIVSLPAWRNEETCPMECTNGRVYMPCGPRVQRTCGADLEEEEERTSCEEGCFCPEGLAYHEGKCISPAECPCRLRGRSFAPGESVPKGCNTCTCVASKWVCTQTQCAARCSVLGDPHYTTFDGKHYDFMGKCKYYLLKDNDYSIEGENVVCSGAISESMGFSSYSTTEAPSCTKAVTIKVNGTAIKLKQGRQILINGEDINKLPVMFEGIKIRAASSIFLIVTLPNGLEVWWDGLSRVYVNAPAEFHGKTKGLCGTFTENQKEDFLTPEGDVEQNVVSFANKWKSSENCPDVSKAEPLHPCDANPNKRASAEQYCSQLYSIIFSDCHWHVDVETFYKDCIYDMCACEVDVKSCLCPILASYASECAASGINLSWRSQVEECAIRCTDGQVYQICGNSCTRSCADISLHQNCRRECVEGCNCPEGQTLNVHGECIPIGQCPCIYDGLEFSAGHKEIRPGTKGQELCTCAGGVWNCKFATPEEIQEFPSVSDLAPTCRANKNMQVTNCKLPEPRTCHNMHESARTMKSADCKSGCVCKLGYVLDSPSGSCIKEEDCPCHHSGKSYKDGEVIQQECNTCRCVDRKWQCTDRICPGTCSVWGDSHHKTFDGRLYDFQGACNYIMAKSSLNKEESFDVLVQNVPCGTTGATCSKSIVLVVGTGVTQEKITLTIGKELPTKRFNRIVTRTAGHFVFLDVPDLGLVLQWDKGTRVYLRLDPKWKGRTKGLCGDYNDNAEDDFKTPSGGIPEVSANLFGDSWKKDEFCPVPKDIKDPCEQNLERKLWAVHKCGILKSSVFTRCHAEVDVEPYIKNCIFDSCACDSGGDCECLCTAVSAYAHECAARGVVVKWRTKDFCPMQCDERCSVYSSCIPTCPQETCDNSMILKDQMHLCAQDTCVEGCSPKPCPEDHVFWNSSFTECVPKSECKPFCAQINSTTYYEGDEVNSDACHTCFCTRGKVICKGEPCTTPAVATTMALEQPTKCVNGWTAWLNRDVAVKGKKFTDVEPLPVLIELVIGSVKTLNESNSALCDQSRIVDIKCRTVNSHLSPKETGQDVECSLERGLYCQSSSKSRGCDDYEISVLCRCEEPTVESTTQKYTEGTTPGIITPEICDVNHPNKEHLTNCHLFYQCVPNVMGYNTWVEKSCGSDMFYNPHIQVCDWPANVLAFKPNCNDSISRELEILVNTTTVVNATTVSTANKTVEVTDRCQSGEEWNDCAIECSRTCQYYRHILISQGHCNENTNCIPGCVPEDKLNCPPHKFWRDANTCVNMAGCTCISHEGELVKPGVVVKKKDCEICQCINNYYVCDANVCSTTVKYNITEAPTTVKPNIILTTTTTSIIGTEPTEGIFIPSTVTPPELCYSNNYTPIIQNLLPNGVTFNASSTKSGVKEFAKRIRPPILSGSSWQPNNDDLNQWLEITFRESHAIYGVIMQGDLKEEKFVTSYKILFSNDGHTFSYVLNDKKKPHLFRGPIDSNKKVEQKFYEPIEAKILRIVPLTWFNGIAIRIELLGCKESTVATTESFVTITPSFSTFIPIHRENIITPACEDEMGIENGMISSKQITASSTLYDLFPYIRLSSTEPWRALLNTPDQYVQIDFLELRNLTGITTKGGWDAWTTAYKIYYSSDKQKWNPVLDQNGAEKEFLANFDGVTAKTNYFEKTIQTRYLRIHPTKWHNSIALRLEIIGCFVSYQITTAATTVITTTTSKPTEHPVKVIHQCNICAGIVKGNEDECICEEPYWWDGTSCVIKQECPCVKNHVVYPVGAMYETDDCEECLCSLNGVSTCMPKKCEPCDEPNHQSILTELCTCACKPCPTGTRHCPTSDVCINETLWCNGVKNCADDETDCPYVSISPIETTTLPPEVICEDPTCPPGYKLIIRQRETPTKSKTSQPGVKSFTKNVKRYNGVKGGNNGIKGGNNGVEGGNNETRIRKYLNQTKTHEETISCQQFSCVPNKPPPTLDQNKPEPCPDAVCPPNYSIIYEPLSIYKLEKCPKYVCKPPEPTQSICNITGRTFNTFDDLEYKYEICNHILAREMYKNTWYISLEKQCSNKYLKNSCVKVLVISVGSDIVLMYPNMRVDINQYTFTTSRVTKLADPHGTFTISRIGDSLYFFSTYYGFWVIYDTNSNIKIGASTKLMKQVDGLCGYFDGYTMNDRQLPDGTRAQTTATFGDSWAMDGAPECEPETQICSRETQVKAWEICSANSDRTFDVCTSVMSMDKFISRCMESTCACLTGNRTYEECRCNSLTSLVTQCQAADQNIDLSTWRSTHNCPVECPAPLVHKDCFRNKCELTCNNLQDLNACPTMQGVCFSGCFCPDGMIRDGERCIPTAECHDCSCDGYDNSQFVTFDKKYYTFNGNCSYLLSRDIARNVKGLSQKHKYEIIVTKGTCNSGVCTKAITVVFEDHVVQIKQSDEPDRKFVTIIDGSEITELPYETAWLMLHKSFSGDIKLVIPAIQLELTNYLHNFAFNLKLSSRSFGDAMEGLCGNCNNEIDDDMRKRDGEITDKVQEFGESWLVTESYKNLDFDFNNCNNKEEKECILPADKQNLCERLLTLPVFGQCHNIINYQPYLTACEASLCSAGSYCDSLESYAKQCLKAGLCLNWRTETLCSYDCPSHLEYRSCGPSCDITCKNFKEEPGKTCEANSVEGCFCPEGHVLNDNSTCIDNKRCFACDEDGHYDGDVWYPDKCTTCNCNGTTKACNRIECPALETVCDENFTPVPVPGTDTDCCIKYSCIPKKITPLCNETQKPECGYGQITKMTNVDGCDKFVCECLPFEDCPPIDEVAIEIEELEAGYIRVINTSGCCPKPNRVCDPDTCPRIPQCPNYYAVNVTHEDKCCPDYTCEPPRDICLYESIIFDDKEQLPYLTPKRIGEKWQDDKCRTCVCEETDNGAKSNCYEKECITIDVHPDYKDYVLTEEVTDECCPNFERIGCKDGENSFTVGDIWHPDKNDVCVTAECNKNEDGIYKSSRIVECTTSCSYGFEYRPSTNVSAKCCGDCIQIGCITDNGVKQVGDIWFSDDHCTNFTCISTNGTLRIESVIEKCPEINSVEVEEYEFDKRFIPGECCPKMVKTGCLYDGKVYRTDEQWKAYNDTCISMTCEETPNGLIKKSKVEVCSTQCQPGWEYRPSNNNECCGYCEQTSCFVNGVHHKNGDTWSFDNCTFYTCNKFVVQETAVNCPNVENCPAQAIYHDGCCKQCDLTKFELKHTCEVFTIDSVATVGAIAEQHFIHGFCKNIEPIEGITECHGSCESSTRFDFDMMGQWSNCQCCQPSDYKALIIELLCEDGKQLKKQIKIPTTCSCQGCASANAEFVKQKGGRKG